MRFDTDDEYDAPEDMGEDASDGHAGEPASSSRVSVVDESPRPSPPPGANEDDYKWHTYRVYPSGRPDAVDPSGARSTRDV